MKFEGAIGVFDSGYGGLTVLKEIAARLPEYDYVYIGDNARSPYGQHSFDVVYEYTLQAVRRLFDMGCPLVILACNTASAKALRAIQRRVLPLMDSSRRVLGVIRPSVEALGHITRNGHIGILATPGTVASGSYIMEIDKLYPDSAYSVTQQACPMWVPLVENNELEGEGTHYFVKKYIDRIYRTDPLLDTLVLGCTHYPVLKKLITSCLPSAVRVVDQGPIVAASLENYLFRHPEMDIRLSRRGNVAYFTTENPELFSSTASLFMGKSVVAAKIVLS